MPWSFPLHWRTASEDLDLHLHNYWSMLIQCTDARSYLKSHIHCIRQIQHLMLYREVQASHTFLPMNVLTYPDLRLPWYHIRRIQGYIHTDLQRYLSCHSTENRFQVSEDSSSSIFVYLLDKSWNLSKKSIDPLVVNLLLGDSRYNASGQYTCTLCTVTVTNQLLEILIYRKIVNWNVFCI